MNEQHQEVQLWLERLYGGEPVPEYELSKTSVSVLYNLMKRNQAVDKDTQLIVDDLRQKSEEYNSEARRIEGLLSSINLTIASLSQSGVMSLRTLANLALLLQVKDPSDTSYFLALQSLQDELYTADENTRLEQRLMQELVDKTKNALLKYNNFRRALQVLKQQVDSQHPETEKKAKALGFLRSKTKEYLSKTTLYQNCLTKIGADPSIYHGTLVKMSEDLQKLKDKMVPLKSRLNTYHSLPPDISMTKVKIEELRREVAALETELQKNIDLMHM